MLYFACGLITWRQRLPAEALKSDDATAER